MRFGERMLNNAERKFGNLAFPGILRWIAGFQLLGFVLIMFSQGYAEMIAFDKEKIFSGEVWRILSWLFLPMSRSFLFLIMVFFIFFLNDLIEEAIGTFRLNVYVVTTVMFLTLAALSPLSNGIYLALMSHAFFGAMVFAAASFYPNYVIHLMGIIPIKMKWLAWMDAAILFGSVARYPIPFINAALIIFGLLPFFIGIFPEIFANLKNEATATARRSRFQRKAEGAEAFHTCHSCGITDADDPNMEFRISSEDGEEYCLPCREIEQRKSAS